MTSPQLTLNPAEELATDYAGNLAGQAVNVSSWDMRQRKGGSDVSRMIRH
jgi:hypothetical protein